MPLLRGHSSFVVVVVGFLKQNDLNQKVSLVVP